MLRSLVSLVILCCASQAHAWNDMGHMVVAELAYQRLTPAQRDKIAAILQQHPHYKEFLAAERPAGVPEGQWAFWRAATWPDWVKHHQESFSHGDWHYIDFPYIPPGSAVRATDHPPKHQNILVALPTCVDKARATSGSEKAINLCWVIHLIGDIHQPLHCATLFSEQCPKGDAGGNDSVYRIGGHRTIKLHPMWDDLLGKGPTPTTIAHGAQEAQTAVAANRSEVTREEIAAPTFESWAKESYALAVAYAYTNGSVIPAVAEGHKDASTLPAVPDSYAETAGLVARVCIGKAGERLAGVLGQIVL
ncbi:MAG TPA: S1/P1 nuclease [Pirellulales bacterium]